MKKISAVVAIVIIGILVGYLFLWPQDYQIRFNVNTFPGAINQTLKVRNKNLDNPGEIVQGATIEQLRQTLTFGDSTHIYKWRIKRLTDSTSRVIVNIKDMDHSLMNKIKVPFMDTDFEKRSRKTVLDFSELLTQHIDRFKVTIVGESEVPTTYAAYVTIKTTQHKKAAGMMDNLPLLSNAMLEHGVEPNGPPLIEVLDWNMKTDSVTYNFCFPIVRSEKLPIHPEIKYKRVFSKKALKAIYNGNYITSDRAWYALLHYAKKNNIEVDRKPVEIFYNNPNTGGDEVNWKAEIFMPIKETHE